MNQQQLIEDNIKFVYFVINNEFSEFRFDEDIIQCGMIGLIVAADIWDESKAKFPTLAYKCIKNEIYQELRRRRKHYGILSLNQEVRSFFGEGLTLEDIISHDFGGEGVEFLDEIVLTNRLSERDKLILDYRKNGMTLDEIGKRLGITKQAVSLRLNKIRKEYEKINAY